jgi:hypothetical protein
VQEEIEARMAHGGATPLRFHRRVRDPKGESDLLASKVGLRHRADLLRRLPEIEAGAGLPILGTPPERLEHAREPGDFLREGGGVTPLTGAQLGALHFLRALTQELELERHGMERPPEIVPRGPEEPRQPTHVLGESRFRIGWHQRTLRHGKKGSFERDNGIGHLSSVLDSVYADRSTGLPRTCA